MTYEASFSGGHVLRPNLIVVCISLNNLGTAAEQVSQLWPLVRCANTIVRMRLAAQHES